MAKMLSGRTAVITGAASGIGRAIALSYADHGADIVVGDVTEEPREGGRPTHEMISERTDSRGHYVDCDVTEPRDLRAAVATADEFGGIDVMVNNAGIVRLESFLDLTSEEYDQVMAINAKGVFFGAQAAAQRLVDRIEADEIAGGSIINMSSIAGLEGAGDYVSYSASKGAVRLMTYAQADTLSGTGIRVNAIHPGPIRTQLMRDDLSAGGTDVEPTFEQAVPIGRIGEPEDVANAAVFLASDMASYVNSESLVVDGGMYRTRGTALTE